MFWLTLQACQNMAVLSKDNLFVVSWSNSTRLDPYHFVSALQSVYSQFTQCLDCSYLLWGFYITLDWNCILTVWFRELDKKSEMGRSMEDSSQAIRNFVTRQPTREGEVDMDIGSNYRQIYEKARWWNDKMVHWQCLQEKKLHFCICSFSFLGKLEAQDSTLA